MASALLTADAKNRGLRSFLQGLAIDVGVGVALVLATTFGDANDWGDLEWTIIGFSLAKSVVQAAAAFVMRRFLDASSLPTPLPPTPQPEPADHIPDDAGWTALEVLAAVALVLVIIALCVWLFDFRG